MSKVYLGARLLLGLIFVVFGLNGFFQFIPVPPLAPEAGAFMGALMETGYMLPFIKITEVAAGALILGGLFVPFALVVLAPVVLNIFFFHLFLDPGGLIMALVIVMLMLLTAWNHRERFGSLFY